MKRCAITIIACLLLGAVINVAVAWGCVCWCPAMTVLGSEGGSWPFAVPGDWPAARLADHAHTLGLSYRGARGDGLLKRRQRETAQASSSTANAGIDRGVPTLQIVEYLDQEWPGPAMRKLVLESTRAGIHSAGWPAFSLRSERLWLNRLPSTAWSSLSTSTSSWQEGIRIPDWIPWCDHDRTGIRRLPIRIIPLGFAINTVFHASCVSALFLCPRIVRNHFRLRRGCCIACGYDLRGAAHERCPECGRQLPPHGATSATRMKRASS